jgi:hypothetical protein
MTDKIRTATSNAPGLSDAGGRRSLSARRRLLNRLPPEHLEFLQLAGFLPSEDAASEGGETTKTGQAGR